MSSHTGRASRCRLGGVIVACITWFITLASFSPANRRRAVSASQSTTEAAYTSVLRDAMPVICSGAM